MVDNGNFIPISKSCDSIYKGGSKSLTLNNVLYTPTINKLWRENNLLVVFYTSFVPIKDPQSNVMISKGRTEDGIC